MTYTDTGGKSAITVTSGLGPMQYKVLSDPTNSGGYVEAGTFTMRGNGTATTETFNHSLGAITVGDFTPADGSGAAAPGAAGSTSAGTPPAAATPAGSGPSR